MRNLGIYRRIHTTTTNFWGWNECLIEKVRERFPGQIQRNSIILIFKERTCRNISFLVRFNVKTLNNKQYKNNLTYLLHTLL